MGEIRSPYFSCGGPDYLGGNAEIQSPYFSYGTRGYHGDNAEIHSSHFSAGDYDGEDAEIPSEAFFHLDNNVENPYNAEQYNVQNTYNTGKRIQQNDDEELYEYIAGPARKKAKASPPGPYYRKSIYKVPKALRESMGDIYTPRHISIGPIHHNLENLRPMEEQKKKYFREFLYRVDKKIRDQGLKFVRKLWNTIVENKEKIRRSYEDYVLATEDDPEVVRRFVKMVLLDAVFILEYLLRHEDPKNYEHDPVLTRMRSSIRWDLMLLENQLPFFILQELYDLLPEDIKGNYSFPDVACAYFKRHIKSYYKPGQDEILHFTDLVRYLLSFEHPKLTVRAPIVKFYSATRLHEAAIKFKRLGNGCLLDIKFNATRGELSIPSLEINRYTECIFGNLIALEKCHYREKEYICHYLKLFETLIAKSKDADLLSKNKIIDTNEDGTAVKRLIGKLSAETSEDYSCYSGLYEQLHSYYEKSWMQNSAYLRETYFGNLWKGTATVSAALLLLLTLVQAICSVLSLL